MQRDEPVNLCVYAIVHMSAGTGALTFQCHEGALVMVIAYRQGWTADLPKLHKGVLAL